MRLEGLSAPFPRSDVHWRIQGSPVNRNGKWFGMALAYIDARDVMDRLDDVCGAANWQSEFTETPKGRVICRLGILLESGWVWKSDGAGDTDVEGDKGGISDSLKRAAVSWGIGRYLYRLKSPWVECLVNEKGGKTYWKKWAEDPWAKVENAPPEHIGASKIEVASAIEQIASLPDMDALKTWWSALAKNARHVAEDADVIAAKDNRKEQLTRKAA